MDFDTFKEFQDDGWTIEDDLALIRSTELDKSFMHYFNTGNHREEHTLRQIEMRYYFLLYGSDGIQRLKDICLFDKEESSKSPADLEKRFGTILTRMPAYLIAPPIKIDEARKNLIEAECNVTTESYYGGANLPEGDQDSIIIASLSTIERDELITSQRISLYIQDRKIIIDQGIDIQSSENDYIREENGNRTLLAEIKLTQEANWRLSVQDIDFATLSQYYQDDQLIKIPSDDFIDHIAVNGVNVPSKCYVTLPQDSIIEVFDLKFNFHVFIDECVHVVFHKPHHEQTS